MFNKGFRVSNNWISAGKYICVFSFDSFVGGDCKYQMSCSLLVCVGRYLNSGDQLFFCFFFVKSLSSTGLEIDKSVF